MPIFGTFFLLFTLANIGFPPTSSFIGEFLILFGVFKLSPLITFFGSTGMFLSGGYSLWLLNRIAFGNLNAKYLDDLPTDIDKREFFSLFILLLCVLFFGIYPNSILNYLTNFYVSLI